MSDKKECNRSIHMDYREQKSNFNRIKDYVQSDPPTPITKDSLNNNANSHCKCGDRVTNNLPPKKKITNHPIVNLCQSYVESVFFQYDSAPGNNAVIAFNNDKKGRIIKFTYFLDSSAGDAVTVWVDKISANKGKAPLLNFVQGGNTYIKGTFNTQTLEFNLNMKILNDEQIQLTIQNASANDVTIMAIADIKYSEEDFEE